MDRPSNGGSGLNYMPTGSSTTAARCKAVRGPGLDASKIAPLRLSSNTGDASAVDARNQNPGSQASGTRKGSTTTYAERLPDICPTPTTLSLGIGSDVLLEFTVQFPDSTLSFAEPQMHLGAIWGQSKGYALGGSGFLPRGWGVACGS
eukprot:GHVT01010103.1.p1 GENE.GHVT01010103.1~~GHVT01010103.1.p1  ORF type:complete len:148 (-),score=7.21 GHVT01010103.1:1166-1609(-)